MPTPPFDDVTLIVRHCGERTTEACAQLLQALAPRNQIHRVSAQPFQETLRRSLELGIAEARTWTLCIDADVLILPELAGFLAAVDRLPGKVFEAQALVLDKLLPTRRPAGNHLYRTELLAQALQMIPAGNSHRPEAAMIVAMAKQGYRYHQDSMLVGLHDFEQSYEDICQKAFLHAHKHRFLAPLLLQLWEALGREDDDFRAALAAFEEGLRHEDTPPISRGFRSENLQSKLASLSLAPKAPLAAVSPEELARMMRAATSRSAGATGVLIEKVQAEVDAKVFPSPFRRAADLVYGLLRMPWWK